MDWLETFKTKFSGYEELQQLKADKFHGSLTIHFCEGVSQSYDFKLHRRAIKIDGNNTGQPKL